MSKTILAIALVAVAIVAPEVIPGLIGVAAGSLAAVAVTAAVEIGIGLASTALIGPATPAGIGKAINNQVQRLFVTMDTTAPRKIVFGDTAGATDLRYQGYTDKNSGDQGYYHQIIAVASHQVNAIYEVWFDNEIAWSSASGVQGRYVGFLTVDTRTLGSTSNGIAIDSTWTASCHLTGCAYIHLKYDLLGTATDGTNNSPFASGVTNRITVRTQGALRYDPRLDSTVSGGSGSQRAATQSTWAWDANGSRNPALQLLWYLLGWKEAGSGKLMVGMGLPSSRIDLASFAVAANACDESVALNGGGTEPRYRADGVVSEGDDRQSVIETLCATMNAVLRDAGGKISLTVLHNDLATPVGPPGGFTEGDILGNEQWQQTPDVSAMFNICRGRRVDPSNTGLYQLVDTPEVKLSSTDGIDRIDTMDMPFVESNGQAQRLLKQRLQRKQYQGKYTLTGGSRYWQVSLGDVIKQSHQGLGWANKLFRVSSQSIARTGECKLTLLEENAAIYAWDNSESAPVTPGAPTIYNPANSPTISKANSATKTGITINGPSTVTISADSTGAIKSGQLPKPIQFTATTGLADLTTLGTWSFTQAPATGATATIGSTTGLLTITAMNATTTTLTVSFTYAGITRNFICLVSVVNDQVTSTSGGAGGGGGSTGGSSGSTTTLGNTTGTSYDTTNAVSATLQATAGSNGKVACAAPITFIRSVTTSPLQQLAWGKWQWRVVGGTFADIAAEVEATVAAETDSGTQYNGYLPVNMTKTGLTNGTTYEFRFLWRNNSGTAALDYQSGVMTATGS